jgi:hypothetical protein
MKLFTAILSLCFSAPLLAIEPTDRAASHLAALLEQPWLSEWKGAKLSEVRLVAPKKGVAWPTGLPAAWWANVTAPNGDKGYIAWDDDEGGKLIEFAFDAKFAIDTPTAKAITGVPALQQFALPLADGDVASGCVPTSAASVVGFWIEKGQAKWRGHAEKELLPSLAKRIRSRLKMMKIPDVDGFADGKMALAGALPTDLAAALRADAKEHGVSMNVGMEMFQFSKLKTEVAAGRPLLLSCVVRVPQKPELSWGHEVAGVGWAEIAGGKFVGIVDNFLPVKNAATVRWIRADAFSTAITLAPAE